MELNFRSNKFKKKYRKNSYSQCGEDLIVSYIFSCIGIMRPTYWDIGAYHPYRISNTALFYESGCKGLNVEPNPASFKLFNRYRKDDVNINAGVSNKAGKGKYYVLDASTLNTFSVLEVDRYLKEGHRVIGECMLPLLTPEDISKTYFNCNWPDFLSLDVEGLDIDILKGLNYDNGKLIVICVETISYSTEGLGKKNFEIIEFMKSKGYLMYADTYINNIFVRKDSWIKK